MNLQRRISGVLMPLSSLFGSPLCGDLGKSAYRFADFLQRSGQQFWQMLPVNPIDDCFSPYASISTFAADPLYISLDALFDEGLLEKADLESIPLGPISRTAYNAAREIRTSRLRKAVKKFRETSGTKYHNASETFLKENTWVEQHAVFCSLVDFFGTPDWTKWTDTALRNADESALREFSAAHQEEIDFHTVLQLFFEVQWKELQQYCRDKGIMFIGDVPIYVSHNSVDTWRHRHLFQLDETGKMRRVAGVPGDSFNPDGQRWDAPLYDWEVHRESGYSWWLERIGKALQRFDAVRLDHFIGFYNYFSMPPERAEDDKGYWVPGPADEFFDTVLKTFPDAQLIAEDLGVMNTGVHQLRDKYNFPGINVFQFYFDFRRDTDATAEWKENSLVCTGTHDTDTLSAWFDEVLADRKKAEPFWNFEYLFGMIKEYVPEDAPLNRQTILWGIIRKVMSSPGNIAVFPMQDLLGLPTEARMNFPGHASGNWLWRLDESLLTPELEQRLKSWTAEFGRNTYNNTSGG
ncbi:MAG: 4-alpha-glucanotransferase [Planctomycetaceae bacterium]|nr:4-alpha-glucanotransferase [Planctomycetaceae bacterium]